MKSKQYSVYRIIPTAYAYYGLQSASLKGNQVEDWTFLKERT